MVLHKLNNLKKCLFLLYTFEFIFSSFCFATNNSCETLYKENSLNPVLESYLNRTELNYIEKTVQINNPVIKHFFGQPDLQNLFEIQGGSGWLADATKYLSSQTKLMICPKLKNLEGVFLRLQDTNAIVLSPEIIYKPYPGVFFHERIHAIHADESSPYFRPEFLITFVSPRGHMKTGGYEKYMSSDEYEAFKEGAIRSLERAKESFTNEKYEEAFEHISHGNQSILYMGIYTEITRQLKVTQQRIFANTFNFDIINEKWIAIEGTSDSGDSKDIRTVFRIDSGLSNRELKIQALNQINNRLDSLSNAVDEKISIQNDYKSFTDIFYPILIEARKRNKSP